MRICRIATVPFFLLHHLGGQIRATVRAGHDVVVVSSTGPEIDEVGRLTHAEFIPLHIPRQISLLADVRALIALFRLFRRRQFDLVHSTTPKAGLLSALAARMARVPIRLHTFTGQPWVGVRGPVRWVSRACDRLIVRLNTHCYADSPSQRDFLEREGLARPGTVSVIGAGSLGGVELDRFAPIGRTAFDDARSCMGLSKETRVICFVGRATRDKGVVELVDAVTGLAAEGRNVTLLLVGPFEPDRDPLPESTLTSIKGLPFIRAVGYDAHPERFVAVSDLFCLPSYREGFGNVVIEAAAMGVPSVGTRIVGLVDAIEDEVTGLLVPPRDVVALSRALARMLDDDALRARLGAAARERAASLFDAKRMNEELLEEYRRLAERAGVRGCAREV
jgi:glycosyltransferase involved in cell wall biosynthesis